MLQRKKAELTVEISSDLEGCGRSGGPGCLLPRERILTDFLIEGDGSAVMLTALAEDGVRAQHPRWKECLLLRHEEWSLDTSSHAGRLTMPTLQLQGI